jgi:hypothetical protein
VLVSAALDEIVPKEFDVRFAKKARAANEAPRVLAILDAGPFEVIDPQSAAWQRIVAEIGALIVSE